MSISNAGYSGLSPNCIPEYLSATKYTKTSVSCTVGYPEYQSGTQGIVACYMKCTPEYQSATKYMKSCQLHCTLMYQSVTWDIHLECIDILEYRSATIKVYEDLSATLVPGVSVSNPGYNSLSPRMFCSIGSRSIIADWYSLVYTLGDRSLYTGLLTDIPGSSVAYRSSYILCCWLIFRYTFHVTGHYTPGYRLIYWVTV